MALSVVQYGSVCFMLNGAISSGTTSFADTTDAPFTSAIVTPNPNITVKGAGAAGADLSTTISFSNTTTATTVASAGTTVTAAKWVFGGCPCSTDSAKAISMTPATAIAKGDLLIVGIALYNTANSVSSVTDRRSVPAPPYSPTRRSSMSRRLSRAARVGSRYLKIRTSQPSQRPRLCFRSAG